MNDVYETLHVGDIVQGYDGLLWGVAGIDHEPELVVTLTRHGQTLTGRPPAGTPVTIVQRADVSAEAAAVGALLGAGYNVQLISERWES